MSVFAFSSKKAGRQILKAIDQITIKYTPSIFPQSYNKKKKEKDKKAGQGSK